MHERALLIGILYSVVSVLAIAVGVAIWRSTHDRSDVDTHRLAEREKAWFATAVSLLAAMLFATIFFTPYGRSTPEGAQRVSVRGLQFAWVVTPSQVRAGVPVEFSAVADDVNHGFAVYDPADTFVFQAQVVPDRATRIVHTFDRPGTYEILCFEFCGLDHHKMISRFEVIP